jgi:hypothetical protein
MARPEPSIPRSSVSGRSRLAHGGPWTARATITGVGLRTQIVDDDSVPGHGVRLGRGVRLGLGLGAVALGVFAEWQGGQWPSPSALVDLAAGWALLGSGLIAWSRRPGSRVGPLIVISGFAWFLGTLAGSDIGVLAIVGALALTIHRAPLVQTIVGYPTGRVLGRMSVALVIAAYAYAVVVPLTRDDVATILIATTLVVSTIWTYYRSTGPHRQARRVAVAAAAVLAMPLPDRERRATRRGRPRS